MRKLSSYLRPCRWLMLSLLLVGFAMVFTSCGDDDEPKGNVIDYYMEVEEEFLVDSSSDIAKRYLDPVQRMREAIRKVYPTPDNKGNDEAVVAACDNEFSEYRNMYVSPKEERHFTCLMHLVRAVKSGSVVKQSERLRTYIYDINPVATDMEE